MASPPRLAPSTRLGPYEVVGAIGAGGMGEVYRAKDTRLNREVAVKILPAELAGSEMFRARFEREGKAVSSLNHPHICTLYDVGRQAVNGAEVHYLVLELLEGESLADRLAHGPMPVEQVLRFGVQIAAALDAAHRRGLVHRDLKPGNVMLTRTGAKLLDFGLAGPTGPALRPAATPTDSAFPTEDKPLTEQGTILGTFQYMAPEQLEGDKADARTDIFALGAVLYEMATGRKAFEGKTRTSLIAAIVSSQPTAISQIQPTTPPALDHVIRKCLEKEPDDRWQSARDVMAELQWVEEGGSRAGLPAAVVLRRRTRDRLTRTALAVTTGVAIALGIGYVRRAPRPAPIVRFTIAIPEGMRVAGPPKISPDGKAIAFDGRDSAGRSQLWLRSLDSLEARPVPGTEGAARPFWSPDSRFLAFIAGGKLKKVDVAGGPPQTICDTQTGADGAWSKDGVILFDGRATDPIWRVSASGGVARPEVTADPAKGRRTVGWPAFLPDGRHFLFVADVARERKLLVRALDSGEEKALLSVGSGVHYASGHLFYVRDRSLVAQRFDPRRLEVVGEPFPVDEGLGVDNVGLAHFSMSDTGALAYRAGETTGRLFVWFDRTGKETAAISDPAAYGDFAFSPDGKRLVFAQTAPQAASDLWIRDLARGVSSRFTFEPSAELTPAWSPDGTRIVFSSDREGAADLFVKDASGASEELPLLKTPEDKYVTDWSPDGRHVLFMRRGVDTSWDVWALAVDGKSDPFPVVKTRFVEFGARFSPDGLHVAYQSNESGRFEVYVVEFPQPRGKWQVSTEGGRQPFWGRGGRELLYLSPDAHVMSVPVETRPAVVVGSPRALFQARVASTTQRAHYAPADGGERFLVLAPVGREAIQPMTVVLNWVPATRD